MGGFFGSPGCCCKKACTTDLEFITYDEPTDLNGAGEVTFHIDPPVAGITGTARLLAVPVHHASDTAVWWSMTLADMPIPEGTYTFSADLTPGATTPARWERTIADCEIARIPTCFFCAALPATLYYTKGASQPGIHAAYRQSCVLEYSQMPEAYRPFVQSPNAPRWRSPELTHPSLGVRYVLHLKCGSRDTPPSTEPWLLYIVHPADNGGTTFAFDLAPWTTTDPDNTCSPVSWTESAFGAFAGTITE